MTVLTCLHCGAETTNGLALCELCQRKASVDLEFLPIYFRNLARWRPGRAGSRPVPGSRVLYDGGERKPDRGELAHDFLDEAMTALTTWARALVADRGNFARPLTLADAVLSEDLSDEAADLLATDPVQEVRWLCAGLDHHLTSIATLDWCGEFVRELGKHEARLRGFTDLVPGWYAGACRRCELPTYVVAGLTWVTCGGCGSTTYARDHLETVLREASDWIARPKAIAVAVVALVDTEQSVPRLYERIKKWDQREQIVGIQRVERGYELDDATESLVVADQFVGPKRYRLGDVLDRIFAEGQTRPEKAPEQNAASSS